MIKVEIRKMQPEEKDGAMDILAQWNMAPLTPSATHADPERSGLDPDRTFVALAEGRVVGVGGYILRDDAWAETASLAVAPEWRGKGVGESLQRARLAEMKAIGVRHVRTETDRPETIAWYTRKFGYRVTGTNPKKHSFSLEDVDYWTVLTLDLQDWGGPS